MYLMLGDEADFEQGKGQKFFVYGAIFVPPEAVKSLCDGIEAARLAAKYKATDSLKFAVNRCPEEISKETFRDLKSKVIELAVQHKVVFCAYAILHALASTQAHRELVTFGANTLLGKFDEFLSTDKDTFGFVMFDKSQFRTTTST